MTEPAPDRRRRVAVSSAVGALFGLVALAFVARAVWRDRETIEDALELADPAWMLAGLALAGIGMVAIAVPWGHVLAVLGGRLPTTQVVSRYFVGELGKYVPGGVWPILGRGELARRAGVPRAAAYGSVFLSLAALYLAASLVVVAGLPAVLGDDTAVIAPLVLLPVGLLALHPRVVGATVSLLARVVRRPIEVEVPSWGTATLLVARYVPAWLAIGTATWAVARSLAPGADLLDVGTAAVLSWIVGFVVVPVPGGVGVREAAFVAAVGSIEPGLAGVVAVVARILFVLVDTAGAAIGSVVMRRAAPTRPGPGLPS